MEVLTCSHFDTWSKDKLALKTLRWAASDCDEKRANNRAAVGCDYKRTIFHFDQVLRIKSGRCVDQTNRLNEILEQDFLEKVIRLNPNHFSKKVFWKQNVHFNFLKHIYFFKNVLNSFKKLKSFNGFPFMSFSMQLAMQQAVRWHPFCCCPGLVKMKKIRTWRFSNSQNARANSAQVCRPDFLKKKMETNRAKIKVKTVSTQRLLCCLDSCAACKSAWQQDESIKGWGILVPSSPPYFATTRMFVCKK